MRANPREGRCCWRRSRVWQPLSAATLGWIVVARGLVLEDRRKAWVHRLAGTSDDMARFGVMHPCGGGRRTAGDQKTQTQTRSDRMWSIHGITCSGEATLPDT